MPVRRRQNGERERERESGKEKLEGSSFHGHGFLFFVSRKTVSLSKGTEEVTENEMENKRELDGVYGNFLSSLSSFEPLDPNFLLFLFVDLFCS